MTDDDDALPSMANLEEARASQQARTASIDDILEMKRQARAIALELVTQAAGRLPIDAELLGAVSEKLMDHAVGFLSGLGAGD